MEDPGADTPADTPADIAVVGAGAAGLSLVHRLAYTPGPDGTAPTVVLVEAPEGPVRAPARTWCFWETGEGPYDEAVRAGWDRLRVRGPDGRTAEAHLGAARYKMLRSTDFAALVDTRLAPLPRVRRLTAVVDRVRDDPAGGAVVHGTDTAGAPVRVRARWVFDSRPPRRLPPARSTLLQHFRGWFVRCSADAFDPSAVELMDFRTPQPAHGLSFGYVLPLGRREALVEYTEFSRTPLSPEGYERALRDYTGRVLGLGGMTVTGTEQGVIPMTDAVFPRRAGRCVFRIGTAGGATRPATGYTFAAVQRQSDAIADAWRRGRVPVPPAAHAARHRAMDAVMLRAVDTGRVAGARFFSDLFLRNPPDRLLRFLDGRSRWWEEFAIGLSTPVLPMLRSAVELPVLPRRAAVS
ncbi:lycopene cyclase [Streptomyces carminius]|uniref:Lycopene cyclase n=1 Tax=Streptomyces carminius TaxID=2665496 RepID=A0A2M8M1N3_9ACTN|nr:lycopene cyclase [Streptomyces carminius]PJF01938.1 lycopene cyclase [Streptomyces carminius]